MTKSEVMELLCNLGNDKRKQMYIKNGASENTYGVLLGELRKLGKKLGKDHSLALELWNSENTDAMWLSCLIMDKDKLNIDEIKTMLSNLTYNDMIDKFVNEVIVNHKDAEILYKEWENSKKDNLGRAGWNIIVHHISKGKLANEELDKLLIKIENELQGACSGKQWAINHALCKIGINYPEFTERCITLGENLGVYKELKVAKGCTSAYAPNWIEAGIKQKRK